MLNCKVNVASGTRLYSLFGHRNLKCRSLLKSFIINQIQFSGWISALESSPASWLSNFYCARNIFNIEISQQGTSGEGLEGLLLSLGLCHWNSNCFCWQKSLAGDLHKFVLPVGSIGFWFNKWQILQIWILWNQNRIKIQISRINIKDISALEIDLF